MVSSRWPDEQNLRTLGGIAYSDRTKAADEIDSDSDQTLTVSHNLV